MASRAPMPSTTHGEVEGQSVELEESHGLEGHESVGGLDDLEAGRTEHVDEGRPDGGRSTPNNPFGHRPLRSATTPRRSDQ
jgi:hypothetical protein